MSHTWRSNWVLSLALASIVLAGICLPGALAQGDPERSTFGLSATVLIDPQGTAYFSNTEGAVTAVKLDSGAQLWTTPKGKSYRPLTVSGKYLVAMQEGGGPKTGRHLGVAFLQIIDGSEHLVSWVELPSEAWASVKNGLGSALRVSAAAGPSDKVTVAWVSESQKKEMRGAELEEDDDEPGIAPLKAQAEVYSGVVEIEPNGRVQPLSRGVAGVAGVAGMAGMAGITGLTGVAGSAAAQLLQPVRQDLSADQLLKGLPETQFTSADKAHILVSELKGNDYELNKYRWTIYPGSTKEPLGTIAAPFPTAPFFVSGSTLIYQLRPFMVRDQGDKMTRSPLKLVAMDLRTGSKLWEQQIMDLEYYGPFPP